MPTGLITAKRKPQCESSIPRPFFPLSGSSSFSTSTFRDIHQFVPASHLQMLPTGYYDGMEITEELMLLGGVLVQVPIAMMLFSLLLTRRIGRPATILAAIITTGTLLYSAPTDLDDTFHLVIELAALAAILWIAWTWTDHERATAQANDHPL